MAHGRSPVKFTYEDYLLFPDDRHRHEIIDGEHYVTPSPSTRHQKISLRLSSTLFLYLRKTKLGEVLEAPCDVVLSNVDVVQPDLLYVSSANASIITEKHVRGAPDLIIEILSETTRKADEVTKRKLYQRHGVAEYWIVDPVIETVKVYRLRENAYVREAELSLETGDTLSTSLLPELEIPLAEIFRD